jgi:hypothetical protein
MDEARIFTLVKDPKVAEAVATLGDVSITIERNKAVVKATLPGSLNDATIAVTLRKIERVTDTFIVTTHKRRGKIQHAIVAAVFPP